MVPFQGHIPFKVDSPITHVPGSTTWIEMQKWGEDERHIYCMLVIFLQFYHLRFGKLRMKMLKICKNTMKAFNYLNLTHFLTFRLAGKKVTAGPNILFANPDLRPQDPSH
jgi:hypothetical protein